MHVNVPKDFFCLESTRSQKERDRDNNIETHFHSYTPTHFVGGNVNCGGRMMEGNRNLAFGQ